MSASAEAALMSAGVAACRARAAVAKATAAEREAVVAFVDEAKLSHWTWDQMGSTLGVSPTAVRRYYERNRRNTHGGA